MSLIRIVAVTFGCVGCLVVLALSKTGIAQGQEIRISSEVLHSGTVRSLQSGKISLTTDAGKVLEFKIQDKDENAIAIANKNFDMPAKISVTGALPISLVDRGMIVQFAGRTNPYGKCDGEVQEIKLLAEPTTELKVDFLERPEPGDSAPCNVVGRVISLNKSKLLLQVPKAKWARRERITFEVAENCKLNVAEDDLNLVKPGDEVTRAIVYELSNGEKIVKEIEIKLTADREKMVTAFHDRLENQFSHLSDKPGEPREFRSANYILYTDLSERSARILLAKLETMHELIGGYFGKRPRFPIECYVVLNLKKWEGRDLRPEGVAKILESAGLTMSQSIPGTQQVQAVVYSCADHGVCQHEAVHAFCAQTFGSTGPVWYSEGMAEMGQYWKPGELAVNIAPVVIDYLTRKPAKKMADIVAPGQVTGDSWEAYAWRWALCHLLASNSNYSVRFKKLGLNMMSGGNDSFEKAFGNVAQNISFEYDQFVENFGNGYRVDLCEWDWSVKANKLAGNASLKAKVRADAGWQPTKLFANEKLSYDFVSEGEWKTAAIGDAVTADGGGVSGNGKLIGIILDDFHVTGPFELGSLGSFVAPADGQLYLRCKDRWTELADNSGEITINLRRTPKSKNE